MTAPLRLLTRVALVLGLMLCASPLLAMGKISFGPVEDLAIVGRLGPVHFQVQVASDEVHREYGLMERATLAANAGMLFDFHHPMIVRMWMKDTLIPLDMLYIDERGQVIAIEKQAQPGDLTPRGPDAPVLGVLEVAGGTADRVGLRIGDTVQHPMFSAPKP